MANLLKSVFSSFPQFISSLPSHLTFNYPRLFKMHLLPLVVLGFVSPWPSTSIESLDLVHVLIVQTQTTLNIPGSELHPDILGVGFRRTDDDLSFAQERLIDILDDSQFICTAIHGFYFI